MDADGRAGAEIQKDLLMGTLQHGEQQVEHVTFETGMGLLCNMIGLDSNKIYF